MSRGWAGIARLGGIGDNLVAASPMRLLKGMGYMTEMITSESAQVVFHNNPFIDKLSVKKEGDIPGGAEWQKWFVSRAREYEVFGHASHSQEGRHALFVDNTAFWWRSELRRKICAGSYLETAHDIMGVPYEFGPLFFPTDEEKDRAAKTRDDQIGGRYLAWAIAGSRIDKVHPYAAMAIARIISELRIPVVMVGAGAQQYEYAKQVHEHVKRSNGSDKNIHLAMSPDGADPGGEKSWSMRRSLTQVLTADLVVTPDTGFGWATAMEPMPKIAMVSHASVENITKHWVNTTTLHADPERVPCWPCHRLHNDISTCTPNADGGHAAACMSDISVETIIQNVARLWRQRTEDSNVVPLRAAGHA